MLFPFQDSHFDQVPRWEGKIAWLYLDSHTPNPIPTAGIGCAINGLAESLTLGWTLNGVLATPAQIEADWKRVTAMPGARKAVFYRAPGCLELPEAEIVALVQKRYSVFTRELLSLFPAFMSWPIPAQTGTLDLIWGVGEGGLDEYHHFLAAARAKLWKVCAAQDIENAGQKAYAARNAWRSGLFLQAAAGGN